jgi:dTMP kinase
MDASEPLTPVAETLLFAAARTQLVATVIRPALDRGDIVLCDRYVNSTRAYQGYGRGVKLELIDQLHTLSTGLEPDLVVLLDLAPAEGLARRPADGNDDRFGREATDFHERVRDGYLDLASRDPARWLVLDAGQPPNTITTVISERLLA